MNKRLTRTVGFDRKVLGVCGGLGKFFGIDPTLIRVAFAILTIFTVFSWVVVYIVLGLIIPEDDGRMEADYTVRNDQNRNNPY